MINRGKINTPSEFSTIKFRELITSEARIGPVFKTSPGRGEERWLA